MPSHDLPHDPESEPERISILRDSLEPFEDALLVRWRDFIAAVVRLGGDAQLDRGRGAIVGKTCRHFARELTEMA